MIGSAILLLVLLTAPAESRSDFDGRQDSALIVVGDWVDVAKIGGKRVSRRVQAVVESATGLTHHFISGPKGRVVDHVIRVRGNRPSREEIERAFAIARSDAEVRSALSRGMTLDGGFLLEEPPGGRCDVGSRCLQVFVFDLPADRIARHLIVDLASSSLAYANYTPHRNRLETR